MGDNTEAPTKSTSRAKPATRVELVNAERSNGPIGATARVFEKDIDAWLAKGWTRVTKSVAKAD